MIIQASVVLPERMEALTRLGFKMQSKRVEELGGDRDGPRGSGGQQAARK